MGGKTALDTVSSGSLLNNLLLFGRLLREGGLEVTPGRMIDLVKALEFIEIGRKEDFYHTLRCNLVRRQAELPIFDNAFHLFWQQGARCQMPIKVDRSQNHLADADDTQQPRLSDLPANIRHRDDEESQANEERSIEQAKTFSEREILRTKDFAAMSESEIDAVKRLIQSLVWHLGTRRTRRFFPGSGTSLDIRRSLRNNVRYGGELIDWSMRRPRKKLRPLVLIADISGSMDRYSRLLLHFIYSLAGGLDQTVEAFVFSTRLTRITNQLRDFDVERAMADVTEVVPDWSGGTRIGEVLQRFNYDWGRRVLGRGAVVIMISDGWDRGKISLLAKEMARLQRSCFRLIWLNPLLGLSEYEPLTRGMAAALPFIDDFMEVHNLSSLETLAQHLIGLDARRPNRRQQFSRPHVYGTAA